MYTSYVQFMPLPRIYASYLHAASESILLSKCYRMYAPYVHATSDSIPLYECYRMSATSALPVIVHQLLEALLAQLVQPFHIAISGRP